MITKEAVLNNLQGTSEEISKKFDALYGEDLMDLAEELAISYNLLHELLENPDQLNDRDFQSALLYWTALNTIVSATDLLRRGYVKEPLMLLRNALETFSAAYDIHLHQEKYELLIKNPKLFDSTKSINEAKKIHAILGNWYGMLSDSFTHVSTMHIVPHKVTDYLCVGGLWEPEDQQTTVTNLFIISSTLDVLDSLLELTFIRFIEKPRYWEKVDETTLNYTPNKEKTEKLMAKMRPLMNPDGV